MTTSSSSSDSAASDSAGVAALADLLFSSIRDNDVETLRTKVYAPDVKIWHNTDNLEQGIDQNLRVLAWISKNIAGVRYEDVRRQVSPTGFVQQHVLRGTAPSGAELNVPACLIGEVADGRITRINEYLDSAHVAAML